MTYFDYLCGVYEICFRSPAQLNAAERQRSKCEQPKFYDYSEKPITESFIEAATLNIFAKNPQFTSHLCQAKSPTFHNNNGDIVPKSCAGDWLLRYTQNETNFNPWHLNAKFSHFELVPWRQQNKRFDLANAIGWEPFKLTPANQQQLRTLHKFELARSKRLQKQRIKSQKEKFRRQIKIRFIFAMEVRQKKMKLFRSNRGGGGGSSSSNSGAITAATYQRKLVLQRDRHLFVFNDNGYDLAQHWGYFSQRNKGVEEMLVNNASQLNLSRVQKCITYRSSATSPSKCSYQKSPVNLAKKLPTSSRRVVDIVPCDNCRSRCVILIFCSFCKLNEKYREKSPTQPQQLG